ncbi:hypothetical protein [Pontiella sp.]|uniref:hypothetical protein n=1 Tax=Pontiella sp. TaxID=2837462 RepID=UPI0035659985
MKKTLLALFASAALIPAFGEDQSEDVLLVHAATVEYGTTGYGYGSDAALKYIAEFLWGLLEATDGYRTAQVDYDSEGYAHSLADIYYDPMHAGLKATIGAGYRYVVLFESEQGSAFPEIMYEGCRQLSQVVLEAGGTPLLMMYRSDTVETGQYGEYAYRAANGCGIDVVPAGYAMELAGLQGKQTSANTARQAWISACAIYAEITGLDPAATGYAPSYEHFDFYYNDYVDTRYELSGADVAALRDHAVDAVSTHATNVHYTTGCELDGAVVYRAFDVSIAPITNNIHYFYKGSSTHEFTAERIDRLLDAPENDPLSASVHFLGNQNFDTRNWTTNDLTLRAGTFATYADQGLFLFAGGSEEGADAQDIVESNQANLMPMVFDWIKGFDSNTGTASTTSALNNQDCADLWDHYHQRGWKTIPLTVGLGRLNEAIPNFAASDDDLHLSDPMLYMNASMMLAASMGRRLAVPDALSIRRGSWTQAQLATAIELGHDLVKELANLSETSAYVPDSALAIETDALPEQTVGQPYAHRLSASEGDGSYAWELVSAAGLPDGLALSGDGLLSGTATEDYGTWNLAFKVTDGTGAFRKKGLKLNTGVPAATDLVAGTYNGQSVEITLPIYGGDPEGLAYFYTLPAGGTLTGEAPYLVYTPNAGTLSDSFTYYFSYNGVTSEVKTVSITVTDAILYLDAFDHDTLATNATGVGGGLANNTLRGCSWQDDGNLQFDDSGGTHYERRALAYSTNGFASATGFELSVDYFISSLAGAGAVRLSFGLVADDTAFDAYSGFDPFGVETSVYGLGVCMNKLNALIFTDGSSTTNLATGSFVAGANTPVVLRVEPDGSGGADWAWSINGVGQGDGHIEAFDFSRNFHFVAYGQDDQYNLRINSVMLKRIVLPDAFDLSLGRGAAAGELVLRWPTEPGSTYGLMASTNLADGVWEPVLTPVYGTGKEVSVTNPISGDTRFYRVFIEE